MFDCDLGSSAAIGAARREGFERLIASVAVGEVGIVLSREVSRLSRRDKDWCQLLEVCQIFGTLIGDAEQIYDLSLLDDQLVLGIKGTMSVVELKLLQMRMNAGMEAKARRGELKRLLPPGYVYDAEGKVVLDPDRRIREAMSLLFARFRRFWSIRQTFLWFQSEGIEMPVNKRRGAAMKVVWQLPTYQFIKSVLQNPFYAGVYFWRGTDNGRAQALQRQVEQLDYEAARAFEQYNEVDPRNRLVAAELESRWNAKLEELEKLRESVVQIEEQTPALSEEEKAEVLALGERLAHVWDSAHCPAETTRKIICTVIEEVIVTLNAEKDELRFIIHWKGGTHTEFAGRGFCGRWTRSRRGSRSRNGGRFARAGRRAEGAGGRWRERWGDPALRHYCS